MADIAVAIYEVRKHKHDPEELQQQQQQQQLRGVSSSAELYHLPQLYQHQQQPLQQLPQQPQQHGFVVMGQSLVAQQSQQQKHQIQHLPEQQLALEDLNPFPNSVFAYTLFLSFAVAFWVLYLILPRGLRKQYFRANRKRYSKRVDDKMPAAGYWMPVRSIQAQSAANGFENASTISSSLHQTTHNPPHFTSKVIAAAAARQQQDMNGVQSEYQQQEQERITSTPPRSKKELAMLKHPPSPEHPALKKIPPNMIIAETMARLQGRGIRLVAHGVHCDPKRVWIRLQEETKGEPSVTWQTEFPRRVPDQNGHVSIVLMRGSMHSIQLKNILYIDVGKKTHALQLTRGVPDTMCLSLLTQNGSLDLQANSKLERDSLVSCFSMILDDIHEEDWRALYEASPEPSLANSSTVFGSGPTPYTTFNFDSSRASTTPGSGGTNYLTPNSHVASNLSSITTKSRTKTLSEEKDRMLQML